MRTRSMIAAGVALAALWISACSGSSAHPFTGTAPPSSSPVVTELEPLIADPAPTAPSDDGWTSFCRDLASEKQRFLSTYGQRLNDAENQADPVAGLFGSFAISVDSLRDAAALLRRLAGRAPDDDLRSELEDSARAFDTAVDTVGDSTDPMAVLGAMFMSSMEHEQSFDAAGAAIAQHCPTGL